MGVTGVSTINENVKYISYPFAVIIYYTVVNKVNGMLCTAGSKIRSLYNSQDV